MLTHLVQESEVGTVDVRMVPIQRKKEIALKELLQFVRDVIVRLDVSLNTLVVEIWEWMPGMMWVQQGCL